MLQICFQYVSQKRKCWLRIWFRFSSKSVLTTIFPLSIPLAKWKKTLKFISATYLTAKIKVEAFFFTKQVRLSTHPAQISFSQIFWSRLFPSLLFFLLQTTRKNATSRVDLQGVNGLVTVHWPNLRETTSLRWHDHSNNRIYFTFIHSSQEKVAKYFVL